MSIQQIVEVSALLITFSIIVWLSWIPRGEVDGKPQDPFQKANDEEDEPR